MHSYNISKQVTNTDGSQDPANFIIIQEYLGYNIICFATNIYMCVITKLILIYTYIYHTQLESVTIFHIIIYCTRKYTLTNR